MLFLVQNPLGTKMHLWKLLKREIFSLAPCQTGFLRLSMAFHAFRTKNKGNRNPRGDVQGTLSFATVMSMNGGLSPQNWGRGLRQRALPHFQQKRS